MAAVLDVVVPVFNEAGCLEESIRALRSYLDTAFPFAAVVTIADNASTDDTFRVARRLAAELAGVRLLHLEEKGRGRALKQAWMRSDAAVVAYMDVDLSTGLDALLPLVAPLVSGHSDIAIGTRLSRSSRVVRGPRREVISRVYNRLLRTLMRTGFSDAQCGFKAVRGDLVPILLPLVEDEGWFFDTELLVIAERNGLRIHEVPVDWVDDPDSRVDVLATAVGDLRGMWRVSKQLASGRSRLAGGDVEGDYLKEFAADAGRFAASAFRPHSPGSCSSSPCGPHSGASRPTWSHSLSRPSATWQRGATSSGGRRSVAFASSSSSPSVAGWPPSPPRRSPSWPPPPSRRAGSPKRSPPWRAVLW